jgi:hypothetical protein
VKSIKKFLNLIVVFLVVAFAGLLYSSFKSRNSETHSSSLAKPSVIDLNSKVNKYMQETQRKRTSAELQTINRLQKGYDNIESMKNRITETDPSTVPIDKQIWKDSDLQASEQESQMDVIYRRIYEEEVAKRITEQEKKIYAMEFIENARRSGYNIQLSMDLDVISIQPIRNPQSDYDSLDLKN